MKKQVIITTSFPKDKNDYSGLFTYSYLKLNKLDSVVIAPHASKLKEFEQWDNVKIIRVKYAPEKFEKLFYNLGVPDNLKNSPLLSIFAIPWLIKSSLIAYNQLNKDDILITHWAFPTGISGAFLKFIKKDIIHINIIHSAGITILKNKKLKFFTKFLYKYSDKLHFVNTEHIKWFEALINKKLNKEKLILKPMPITTCMSKTMVNNVVTNTMEQKKANPIIGDNNILYLGRIVKIKGLDLMLDELKSIKKTNIIIAGNGNLKSELENKYVYAKFVGSVFGKEKENLLIKSNIMIIPSISNNGQIEGFPTTILEGAVNKNLLIISKEVKGIDYIFKDRINCLYYNPYKKGELKKIIQTLNQKKMEAMIELGYNSALNVLESYNFDFI